MTEVLANRAIGRTDGLMQEDRAKTWRSSALGDTLFLAAEYRQLRFDPHFHDEFAIGIIDGGCQAFAYDNGRRLDFPMGSVALIAPGVVHVGWPGVEEGWRYRMLYPPADLVRTAAADIFGDGETPGFHRPGVVDGVLAHALSRLHELSARSDTDPLQLESLFLLVIRRAFEHHAGRRSGPQTNGDRKLVAPMRDLLETEFQGPIALATLAGAVGLSRFQALRHFKAAYGLPPHAYLRQVRVRRAQQLILGGERLAAAAATAGFADQAHMTRIFRQIVGYTPGSLSHA
ncbi:AraC family transcriptional regulator [Mesorhizobium sophorae]|uniref:AraC family transcriptional regulator n=1 Tax=Mesorhizobium sophorae TaxID=1300294 RepID=UPI00142DA3E0|nr:AraC family transcriptional regulator [Mesorhizobium sophorae]